MSLWSKTDNLAGAPKFVARKAWFDSSSATVDGTNERISLLNSNTGFSTGDAVVYSKNDEANTAITGLTDGNTYYVRVVAAAMIELYDTYAHAIDTGATTGRVGLTATVAAETHTLQRTGAANPYSGDGKAIFFVDRTEAQLDDNKKRGIKGGGWWLYSTYIDSNGVTRHKASCLVAMDVLVGTSGDASDDEVAADKGVTITKPSNRTIIAGNTTTFATTATTDPVGGTVTFQWQVSTNGGKSWSNVSNGGVYSNATTATMTVTAPSYSYNGNKYRVVVAGTGYATKTSNAATLTVTEK